MRRVIPVPMRLALLPAGLALLLAGCHAPDIPPPSNVTVGVASITLTANGETWKVPFPTIRGRDLSNDSVRLLDHRQLGGAHHVLLEAEGPSRGAAGSGHCGAGIETTLFWLKLRDGRTVDSQHRLIRSCWQDVELLRQGWILREYRVECLSLRDGSFYRTRVSYDIRQPDRGFQVHTTLEKSPAPPDLGTRL